MATSFTEMAVVELTKLVAPLRQLRTAAGASKFVRELGWDFDGELDADLSALVDLVDALLTAALDLADAQTEDELLEVIESLAPKIPDIFLRLTDDAPRIAAALQNAPNLAGEPGDLAATVSRRFTDRLLHQYLEHHRPRTFAVMHLVGLAEVVVDDHAMPVRTIHWDRIELLFSDPMKLANEVYGWNTLAGFDGDEFLSRMERFALAFMLPGGVYRQDPAIHQALGRVAGDDRELRIPLFQGGRWPDEYMEFDVNLTPIPASAAPAKKAGFAFYPYFHGSLGVEQALGDGWSLALRGKADAKAGLGVTFRAPHELEVVTDLFSADPVQTLDTRLEMQVSRTTENGELSYIFGDADSTHLGYRQVGVRGLVALQGHEQELGFELEVLELRLKVGSEKADSFVDQVLSGIQIETTCDLTLGYSSLEGAYFKGAGGLEVVVPLHLTLGPICLESILIGIGIQNGFLITLAASFNAQLGPLAAAIDRIGLRIPVSFPPNQDGNLGPVRIESPLFKPPTGAGFSIDAGITGGGFLEFDSDNERYAGILALKFGEIGITAIGLITTRMPDGSKGFSMLINIGVTFDPPIQLSMGFTLSGVGGLVGINRTMMIDVLREGVKKRTLDSILFPEPEWVIPNAAKVISDLRAVFPPAEGRFVIGPMVKIGYGTPNFIVADIGIFLELFEPVRIVLLGQLAMELPEPKDAIVRIKLDIVGVLDFEKKELSFQASLYDSGILTFELFGDSAFFLSWGAQPEFAMSLGGFHPKFTPPPPPIVFADLKRLGLNLSKGSDFQLSCGVYQAVTPNSLQFGARADLFAAAGGAEVRGFLSFDTLIYFSPFSFEIELGAGLNIRYQGVSIADIRVALHLSGPTPWNARGTATVKVLFIDIDVKFNVVWGRADDARLDPVNPWPRLREALLRADSWGSRLPATAALVESLNQIEDEPAEPGGGAEPAAEPIVVHPAGALEVRQNVAPFETTLSKFGNAPVSAYDRFRVDGLSTSDGVPLEIETVDEFFARGQFENLSNAQKLSVPAFERMPGGIRSTSNRIGLQGEIIGEKLGYESVVIKPDRTSQVPSEQDRDKAASNWSYMRFLRAGSAGARGPLRSQGKARFAAAGAGVVGTLEDRYAIVRSESLARAELDPRLDLPSAGMTRAQADQALKQHLAWHPDQAGQLLVVGESEVEEAA